MQLNSIFCSYQLVTTGNTAVAESHSKRQKSFFRKARDMSLEISKVVALSVDVILLTFLFVWKERKKGDRHGVAIGVSFPDVPLSPLSVGE